MQSIQKRYNIKKHQSNLKIIPFIHTSINNAYVLHLLELSKQAIVKLYFRKDKDISILHYKFFKLKNLMIWMITPPKFKTHAFFLCITNIQGTALDTIETS